MRHLAEVDGAQIVIHEDPAKGSGVVARLNLGSASTNPDYTALLAAHGWKIDGKWGWTATPRGANASVMVRRA